MKRDQSILVKVSPKKQPIASQTKIAPIKILKQITKATRGFQGHQFVTKLSGDDATDNVEL